MQSGLDQRRVCLVPAAACCLVLAICRSVAACSVCFGEKDDPLIQGASSGILVMLILTYTLLLGMAGVFATWFVRSRKPAVREQQDLEA